MTSEAILENPAFFVSTTEAAEKACLSSSSSSSTSPPPFTAGLGAPLQEVLLRQASLAEEFIELCALYDAPGHSVRSARAHMFKFLYCFFQGEEETAAYEAVVGKVGPGEGCSGGACDEKMASEGEETEAAFMEAAAEESKDGGKAAASLPACRPAEHLDLRDMLSTRGGLSAIATDGKGKVRHDHGGWIREE